MKKCLPNSSLWRLLLFAALCLAGSPGWSQTLFYATSSATQSNNAVDFLTLNAGPGGSIFAATGTNGNTPLRCTAIALDSAAQLVFLLDAQGQQIWSMNLD